MIKSTRTVHPNGTIEHLNAEGKLHREDGPAFEGADGSKEWCRHGKFHREDGPAIEYANGTEVWYRNGECHRNDGPAVKYANGTKMWYRNGNLHRNDGPAVEYFDGTKEWWVNDVELTEDEFLDRFGAHGTIKNKETEQSQFEVIVRVRASSLSDALEDREGGEVISVRKV